MSNEHTTTAGQQPAPAKPKNTCSEFEKLLGENLQKARGVAGLVCEVRDSLLGKKPEEADDKEAVDCPGGVFGRAADTALNTRRYLGEIWDELTKIIEEIK